MSKIFAKMEEIEANCIWCMSLAEMKLTREIQEKGCTEIKITKTPYQFKVEFRYPDSNAYGSRSIIYDLHGYYAETYAKMRKLEDQLFGTL
jgi:hypothetical protein